MQRSVGKNIGILLLAGVLTAPTSALAQALTREQLVGTWVNVLFDPRRDVRVLEHFLTFGDDGRVKQWFVGDGKATTGHASRLGWSQLGEEGWDRWLVAGDTVIIGNGRARPSSVWESFRIASQDQGQSFLQTHLNPNLGKCDPLKFERVDTSNPRATPTPPPLPAPLRYADLVGTWESREQYTKRADSGKTWTKTVTETMTLKPDSSWAGSFEQYGNLHGYKWEILPGNYFVLDQYAKDMKVTLRGGGKAFVEHRANPRRCQDTVRPDSVIWKRTSP